MSLGGNGQRRAHAMRLTSTLAGVVLLLGAVHRAAGGQTRDSAGVRIVATPRSAMLQPASLVLSATPTIVLGAPAADVSQEFADVPAALVLRDSTIVVVNRATNEIRLFTWRGEFIKAAGRRGQGPGETTSIAAFAKLSAESLAVQDWSTSRVSVFTRSGQLGRSFTLGPPPQRPRSALVGQFNDGTLLGAGSDYLSEAEPPPGFFKLTQTAFRFAASGEPIAPLHTILEREYVFVAGPSGLSRYVMPYGLLGCIRMYGDTFLTGDGSTFEIREYQQNGTLERILRADIQPRRITAADKSAEKARILAFYGQKTTSPGFERFWSAVPWRDNMPAFRRFEVSETGWLWVELYRGAEEAPRWVLFDADRRARGFVTVPARFDIKHIRQDGVLGVQRTADDEERVVFYSFVRG
jgi:hypothetical protein